MKMVSIEKSKIDQSVNFIEKKIEGFLESRYVRRKDDYFICYLSSSSGCDLACRMCHLTATGQNGKSLNRLQDADYQDYLQQALQVFKHYRSECEEKKNPPARICHLNFMARGDFFANKNVLNGGATDILMGLSNLVIKEGLIPKFNISTIFPKNYENGSCLQESLSSMFKIINPTIYYSLYSMNPEFRKKWLPRAVDVHVALRMLQDYQAISKKIPTIHYCFIKGENDSLADLDWVCNSLDHYNLLANFNIVRYNSYSEVQGVESEQNVINRNSEFLLKRIKGKVKVIDRIGVDVAASCGVFVPKNYGQ